MSFSTPRSGAWPAIVLTALFAVNCSDGGNSESPSGGGQANAGSAGSAGSAGATGSPGGESGMGSGASAGSAGDDGQGGAGGADEGAAGAGGDAGGSVGAGGTPPIFVTSTKLDLLLVVDDSISMADKQTLFAASIPALLERLVHPWCLGGADPVPPNQDGSCPASTQPEYPAVQDLHVGVISSSMGSMGGQVCATSPTGDDHGHLIGAVRPGLTTWNGSGFLKWDPMGVATPPGETSADALAADLADMVVATGDEGCGYEMPLEAMYRFLVDPEPPLTVSVVDQITTASGIDQDLLEQRAAFIRPDSAIMVVVISDENDCSIIDQGQGWLVGLQTNANQPFQMPRSTEICATDPNSPCCRSCAANEAVPPNGCGPLASDVECLLGNYTATEDNLNLRCFDQKRRFGFNLLQPISRYVDGLSAAQVQTRAGAQVQNPLFAGGRDPSMVMLTVIAGVPWQDVAVDPSPVADLDFLTTEQLTALDRWDVIVGALEAHVAPTDPFMVESPTPRSGLNPITNHPIVDETSLDPTATINGHEQALHLGRMDDLQYACIFPLPTPVDCTGAADVDKCDCNAEDLDRNRPLCQAPGGGAAGTTQYYGKAYPGLRLLDVARKLPGQSAVASICPRNSGDVQADDYGYYAALRALQARLAPRLTQ